MSERADIEAAVDDFAVAMKARLRSKSKQAWHGWDDPAYQNGIALRMLSNAAHAKEHRDAKSLVDVANLAMFIWKKEQ